MRTLRSISAVALGLTASSAQELASNQTGPPDSRNPLHEAGSEREHLTGDWGGLRTNLVDRGIHLQFGYIGEVFGNVSGGRRHDAVYQGLAEMALDLDFERLTGTWKGGSFRASSLWLHGDSPSELAGDVLTISNIDGHDSLRLYELWLQQNFLEDTISIRAGSLLADEEFAGTEYGGRLLNSAFGWPAFISGNVINTGPAFYVAALGARFRIEPAANWYFQTAVFDGDSFDSPVGDPRVNASGTRAHFSSEQGALVMSEVGFRLNPTEESSGLPGTYKLGAWVHTGDFRDRSAPIIPPAPGGPPSRPRTHDYNFGAYVAAEQMLCAEADDKNQGLGVFFRSGGSPHERSTFALVVDTGVHYTGLIPGRDQDHAALGFVYADISNGRGGPTFHNYEQVVELTYEYVVKPWWSIQPDVQWIGNPGGNGGRGHAFLLGLRSTLTF